MPKTAYAELQVTSNFSFLRGASHPDELVTQAAALGCKAIAITDLNSFAGIVRGHVAAKEAGMRFIVGCHLQVREAMGILAPGAPHVPPPLSLLMYPTDRGAYGRLCRLLTFGKRRAAKGECDLTLQDVIDHHEGSLAVIVPPKRVPSSFVTTLSMLRDVFDADRLSIAATQLYEAGDEERLASLATLSKQTGIPLVAVNDVHYHIPDRKPLQDVLSCIRLRCTVTQAGFDLFAHAERHFKSPDEMARLFGEHPAAIRRTMEIAERAAFSLDELKYQYPAEVCPPGKNMMEHLIDRTLQGASQRYPNGIPSAVRTRLEHEFSLIGELNYPAYFLTVDDIVAYARSKGILCQGRGAAANSAVCYCLGITAVDPSRHDLLVERFISKERNEPPDIDIDFEHERREEVIQYVYQKYGRERAALTAEVITYRRRSAVREVGKALGLSLDSVDRLAKSGDWWDKGIIDAAKLRELGFDARDRTICLTVQLSTELLGFPRHLSQHVGGFIISQGPLCESVPIENAAMPDRTIVEWDKDDIDALGMLKIDVLALGMLTAIRKAIDLVNQWDQSKGGAGALQFHTIPPDDPAVYEMLCQADSIGVFQVESRAQMTMLPRLQPRSYYDLVIEVAIVRPGPIVGNMVHPYLRRRNYEEEPDYPNDEIKAVLGRTLGVPLFQEQAMKLAIVAAGFTAGEADGLRRAMAAWKRKGDLIYRYGQKIITGMRARGYTEEFALRCFEQIKGFSEYGFPESHAASFALLVYVSAWLKHHHPAAFAAALLNSQPMGFYQPAQLVRDAQEHGVTVRPVDVNASHWDCTLEEGKDGKTELRLGMRSVKHLRMTAAERIETTVHRRGPFQTIIQLWRHSGVPVSMLRSLAEADAFGSMGLSRQQALWAVGALRDAPLPMFEHLEDEENDLDLPRMAPEKDVAQDYASVGMSLKAHPISFVRSRLAQLGVLPAGYLRNATKLPRGNRVAVGGLVLVRQRPATASGVIFMTIEDETGVANLIIRPKIYDQYRRAARHSIGLVAWGKIERQGIVVHVLVDQIKDLRELVRIANDLKAMSRDFH